MKTRETHTDGRGNTYLRVDCDSVAYLGAPDITTPATTVMLAARQEGGARRVCRFMDSVEACSLVRMERLVSHARHEDDHMPGDPVEGFTFFPGDRAQAAWLRGFAEGLGCSMEYLLVGTPMDAVQFTCHYSLFRERGGFRALDEYCAPAYALEDFLEFAIYRVDGDGIRETPALSRGWTTATTRQTYKNTRK